MAAKKPVISGKVEFVQHVIKGDTFLVMADSAAAPDDEFTNQYWTSDAPNNAVVQPPFIPAQLKKLVIHNNILNQCVHAMEVNVDGTGHDFVPADEDGDIDDSELAKAKAMFDEPYPGLSMVALRRRLRRDLESTGWGVLEFLRNVKGDLVAFRNLDNTPVRLVRLDAPVIVHKAISRNGQEDDILILEERERRFVRRVAGNPAKSVYYREFGTSRNLNKETGEWESEDKPVPPTMRATELMFFQVDPDIDTAYGLPRWINQMPSVIGSRKAEEDNLQFFDAGGIPPTMIFISGGKLADDVSSEVRGYLSGKNKNRARAVVVSMDASSGSLDTPGKVDVKVERFGAERSNDPMYREYDKSAEEHVRIGFRLPPLFLGRSEDYNFATAKTAYMVAEAQVFQPERTEFDEQINKTVMKAMGLKTLKFKSNPITLKDVEQQLEAIGLVKDIVEPEGVVGEVNAIAGTSLEYKEPEPVPPALAGAQGQPPQLQNQPNPQDPREVQEDPDNRVVKGTDLIRMAHEYGEVMGLLRTTKQYTDADRERVSKQVDALKGEALDSFNQMVAAYTLGGVDHDLVTLVGCGHEH